MRESNQRRQFSADHSAEIFRPRKQDDFSLLNLPEGMENDIASLKDLLSIVKAVEESPINSSNSDVGKADFLHCSPMRRREMNTEYRDPPPFSPSKDKATLAFSMMKKLGDNKGEYCASDLSETADFTSLDDTVEVIAGPMNEEHLVNKNKKVQIETVDDETVEDETIQDETTQEAAKETSEPLAKSRRIPPFPGGIAMKVTNNATNIAPETTVFEEKNDEFRDPPEESFSASVNSETAGVDEGKTPHSDSKEGEENEESTEKCINKEFNYDFFFNNRNRSTGKTLDSLSEISERMASSARKVESDIYF